MQRIHGENPLIQQIKDTFYHSLVNQILDQDDVTAENLDEIINTEIQIVIMTILHASPAQEPVIRLPIGVNITQQTCPMMYQALFQGLLRIKHLYDASRYIGIDAFIANIRGQSPQYYLKDELQQLTSAIMRVDAFRQMVDQLKTFILEAKGLRAAPRHALPADAGGAITPQLIRDSFYNEMVTQVLFAREENWITDEDLEDQESYLFFALPALTLIEAVNQSRNFAGIRLLDDKILTMANCPHEEQFNLLFEAIFKIKDSILALSNDQLKLLKLLCLAKELDLPDELKELKTTAVTSIAAVINEVASQVSRRGVFKQTVTNVINICVDRPQPEFNFQ